LQKARQGQEVATVTLMRTMGIENWLQQLKDFKRLNVTASAEGDRLFQKEGAVTAP
jgi:hypothetical protein